MHHRNINRPRLWHGILRQQAFRRVTVAKADAVNIDGVVRQLYFLAPPVEHMHVWRQVDLPRDRVFRVMVPLDIEHPHVSLRQTMHLRGEIRGGFRATFLPVIKIARDQKSADPLVDAILHHRLKRLTAGTAHLRGQTVILHRQTTKR